MNIFKKMEVLDSAMSSRFVLPVIAENMFTIATTMITTQVISTISSSALAAIGMANTVWNVIVALFSVVTTGTVLLVARQIGAEDREAAADTIEQSILLSISVSAMISVVADLMGCGIQDQRKKRCTWRRYVIIALYFCHWRD